jgi:hypothetical protein
MHALCRLVAIAVPLLAGPAVILPNARAQGRGDMAQVMHVRRCSRADTLFGRLWRSHPSIVRVSYSARSDSTTIKSRYRNYAWQPGTSRLVATESEIDLPGRLQPADSARLALHLSFVDSLYRSPEQARLELRYGDTARMEFPAPQVDYPMDVKTSGTPLIVTVLLTPEQSLALARVPGDVEGTMGPFPFILYSFELWEANAVYRASVCGVE